MTNPGQGPNIAAPNGISATAAAAASEASYGTSGTHLQAEMAPATLVEFAFTPLRRQVPKRPEEAAVLRKVDTKRLLVTQDVENALKVAETGDAGLA